MLASLQLISFRVLRRAVIALALLSPSVSNAQLANKDFVSAGDKLLVTDGATGFEWLTPVFTRNLAYNAAEVQAIEMQHGFRYATALEVRTMLSSNFDVPEGEYEATEAGFEGVSSFFSLFGIALDTRCRSGEVACPRTQGYTSTPGAAPGTRMAYGMIQSDIWGWMITDNPFPETTKDYQLGSWLVRPATVTTAPEPSTVVLLALGIGALYLVRRRARSEAAGVRTW